MGVPVISKPFMQTIGRSGTGNGAKVGGLMGSAPGALQNISAAEVRKIKQEI